MARRKKRGGRRRWRSGYRRNPAAHYRMNPRRRRRSGFRSLRSYRRNPVAIRKAFSRDNVVSTVALTGGFIVGVKAQKYINGMEFMARYRKFSGLVPFLLGTMVAVRGKGKAVKFAGSGVAAAGVYDLLTQNIPQLGLAPVEGVDVDYSDEYADYNGVDIDMDGSDDDAMIVGDDEVIVGDDDEVVVGDDAIYDT